MNMDKAEIEYKKIKSHIQTLRENIYREVVEVCGEEDTRSIDLPEDLKWGSLRISDMKYGRNEERSRIRNHFLSKLSSGEPRADGFHEGE